MVRRFRNTAAAVAFLGAAAAVHSSPSLARAAFSADSVVSYTPGSAPAGYQTAAAALGELNPDTNAGNSFGYGALTPFNAAWQGSQIVAIGAGGSLTLHLQEAASQIGVHSGVGMILTESGRNTDPAATYTNVRASLVEVSSDGVGFVSLGTVTFDSPSNYFDEGITSPAFQSTPGTHAADFGKPFSSVLADFNGKDWASTLDVLDGSAGGEWLDLTAVLPAGANFVRFSVPVGQLDPMFIDAVAVVPVPEPAGALALAAVSATLLRRRRNGRHRH